MALAKRARIARYIVHGGPLPYFVLNQMVVLLPGQKTPLDSSFTFRDVTFVHLH